MTDQRLLNRSQPEASNRQFLLVVLAALLVSFGFTMFVFSAAYAKDVNTLAKAPEMVWAFICGRPGEFGFTLPLLLTLGTMGVLIGVGVFGWGRYRARRGATV